MRYLKSQKLVHVHVCTYVQLLLIAKQIEFFFVSRIQTRHIICINKHFLYREIKIMNHFLLYEFVMISSISSQSSPNRHFRNNFSY